VRDKSNPLRFHLEVVSRYHFEAATVAQLGEIEMSCKVMTGELKKPAGHKANKPSRKLYGQRLGLNKSSGGVEALPTALRCKKMLWSYDRKLHLSIKTTWVMHPRKKAEQALSTKTLPFPQAAGV